MDDPVRPGWLCGAWQTGVKAPLKPYRCSLQAKHLEDNHKAIIDGEVLAEWQRVAD